MVYFGFEIWDELKVIILFYFIGFVFEFFKVYMGFWFYLEEGYFKVFGVFLYSGFMYVSVVSYLCQVWRRFKVELVKWLLFYVVVLFVVVIYLNFFIYYYLIDICWWLFGFVIIVFW